MSDTPITAIPGPITDVKLVRRVTTHRLREDQPSLNAPEQDSIPGPGSGDQ